MPHTPQMPGMTRRGLLGAAVAGAAGLALASCARGTQSMPIPGNLVSLFNDNATWAPGYAAAGAQLKKLAGYGLSPRAVPNTANYQQIVRMSAQTDSTADLIKWWNGYRLIDIARAGILTDVTAAWDEAAANGWSDDKTLRDSFSYDGKQYGMPLYKSYHAVFYSKKAFRTIGADVPATWDDFLHVIDACKAKKITPIVSAGANDWESILWFQQLLNGLDHDFYQRLTAGHASYTDGTAKRAMELWVDLYKRGAFSAPDADVTALPAQFKQGTAAMNLFGTWNTGSYLTGGLKDSDFGAFLLPPPPGGNDSVVVESGVLSVSAKAHKPEAAMGIAKAWLNPVVQRAWTAGFLKDTSADPAVVPKVAAVQQVADQLRQRKPTQAIRYWEASPPALIEGNVLDLSAFMIDPTVTNATKTLGTMQGRADKEWKVWNS